MPRSCRKPMHPRRHKARSQIIGPDRLRPTITKRHDVFEAERFEVRENTIEIASVRQSAGFPWARTLASFRQRAAIGDEHTFSILVNQVHWEGRSVADFVAVIQLALEAGANLACRYLAVTALRYHADDIEIQRYARILAPPAVVSRRPATGLNIKANREWLNSHAGEHPGKWVALRQGTLLDTADSLQELMAKVGNATDVLLTRAY